MLPKDGSRYCLTDFMGLSIHCVDVSFCSFPADDVSTFAPSRLTPTAPGLHSRRLPC